MYDSTCIYGKLTYYNIVLFYSTCAPKALYTTCLIHIHSAKHFVLCLFYMHQRVTSG